MRIATPDLLSPLAYHAVARCPSEGLVDLAENLVQF